MASRVEMFPKPAPAATAETFIIQGSHITLEAIARMRAEVDAVEAEFTALFHRGVLVGVRVAILDGPIRRAAA